MFCQNPVRFILCFVALAAILLLWLWLAWNSSEKELRRPFHSYWPSFVLAAIPGTLLILGIQILESKALSALLNGLALMIVEVFLEAALIEEGIKGVVGILCTHWQKPRTTLDVMLIFGFAGMGFCLAESTLDLNRSSDIITVLLRGLTPFHILVQLVMGYYYAKGMKNGVKYKIHAFGLSVILHGLFDFILSADTYVPGTELISLLLTVIMIVSMFIFAFLLIKKASKTNVNTEITAKEVIS